MRTWTIILAIFVAGAALAVTSPVPIESLIGLNKFDLTMQYVGRASGGGDALPYRRVTRAMARKALADAKDAGVRLMRVAAAGFLPATYDAPGALDLWRSDPATFWRRVDEMMDDLDAYDIQLVPVMMWNVAQFPAMTRETIGDLIRNQNSKSWKLLSLYVTEFVKRYRWRKTIAFYELTNELNLIVDFDAEARCLKLRSTAQCKVRTNISTDELITFTWRFAGLLREIDSSRLISSGFSIPRRSAEHLRARPGGTVNAGNSPDWSPDTREQFAKNLRDIHAAVDIVSIHLYGTNANKRFGSSDAVDLLVEAKRAADEIGKPLFVGEFGSPQPRNAGADSHTARMIKKIVELRVPYSAVWVWQFYQNTTYIANNTKASAHSLEPGYTDYLIERIREVNLAKRGQRSRDEIRDVQPPRVVLTWPLACSVVRDGQSVHAIASDDSGSVSRVEFWFGDRSLGIDRQPPYEVKLSTGLVQPGIHVLTARAIDPGGNQAEFSTTVLVNPAAGHEFSCNAAIQ